MLGEVGVNWVKFPVWYSETDRTRADDLARFTERLNMKDIELVGILDQPPPQTRKFFSESDDRLPAASVFAERDVWYPALSPVLTRLSLNVRWWQLGADDDTSFMGLPNNEEKIRDVAEQLGKFGQSIHLAIGWRWINELPLPESPPWHALNLSTSEPMTDQELATYLKSERPVAGQKRWLMLQPLSDEHYTARERARDLVLRMLAAKLHGADAAFATDPFAPHTGLMNADGSPGELLLPWRTTAHMISGTELLGSITLPSGSQNYILTRGDEAMMIVWNENPTEEVINLGEPDKVEHVDLWGRVTRPETRQHRQAYRVGPIPVFITGISREMALWRMNFHIVDQQLRSTYGRPQLPTYTVKNPFRQGVGGTMQVRIPEMWGDLPPPVRVNMSGGEQRGGQFEVVLRSNASTGEQPVRVDFDVSADRRYEFSVWRKMEVGLGDVLMEFTTHLDEQGNLVVQQTMINTTDQFVNFKCFLFAPGRRRLRQNVLNLAEGTNVNVYTLPEGEELRDQTIWVRAEEIYGTRVLNYRFPATP